MGDARTGIVQTPQCYYNPDPFQRAFGGVASWPDDTRLWHDEKQPRNDGGGRVLCSGTAYLARVRALDEIGGYPLETVTEDTICSLRLRGKGWQTRYLNERLSLGLAPEGLGEFLSQRTRWQYGWVQLFRVLGAGTGARGRLRYLTGLCRVPAAHLLALSWFAVALAQSWFGFWVFQASARQTLQYVIPLWLCAFLLSWLTRGRQVPFVAGVHRLAQSFALLRMNASVMLGGRPKVVAVTDKAVMRGGLTVHWGTLKWLGPLALALIGGLWVAGRRATSSVQEAELFWLNLLLTAYLLLQLLAVAVPALELPQRRRDDRYATNEVVEVELHDRVVGWVCRDLGVGGALLESQAETVVFPERVTVVLKEVGRLSARLVRRASQNLAAYAFDGPAHRPLLIQHIYCSERYVPAPESWSSREALSGLLNGILRFPLVLLRHRRTQASSHHVDRHHVDLRDKHAMDE
jgi:cellulose synthase (UDP-forming)